jgi:hypothetical protein
MFRPIRRLLRHVLMALLATGALAMPAEAAGKNEPMVPRPPLIKMAASWSGEAPAAELQALPQWLPRLRAGCIGDEAAFAAFWAVFKPGSIAPRVDFDRHLVVFVARDSAYEQLAIVKVSLKDGAAEVVASGYRSAPVREDRLAVAAAVVRRAGVKLLKVGGEQAPIEP